MLIITKRYTHTATRKPFRGRPTARFILEIQTYTIGIDLDFEMPHYCRTLAIAREFCFQQAEWLVESIKEVTLNLVLRRPRYGQNVPAYQTINLSFFVMVSKSYNRPTQTVRKHYPYTRAEVPLTFTID